MKWKLFSNLTKNQTIFIYVVASHLFLVLLSLPFLPSKKEKPSKVHQPIQVTQVTLKPKTPIATQKVTASPSKKTSKKKKKPSKKNQQVDQIFAKLDQLQAKISNTRHEDDSNISIGQIALTTPHQTIDTGEKLLEHLQRRIELPKKGEIKLSFVVDEQGLLTNLTLLSCDEEENGLYILHQLNGLKLPKEALALREKNPITLTIFGE